MRVAVRSSPFHAVLGASALLFFAPPAAFAADLAFLEAFALARSGEDRAQALSQLIPGTEDFYFFHALDHQANGRLDEVDKLLVPWIEKHGRTQRVLEIENRQILLAYSQDPKKSLSALRDRLGLSFHHERTSRAADARLPGRLDPALLSREALTRRALEQHPGTTDGFEDLSLGWVAGLKLSPERRRHLLGRLVEPDVPGLPQLVVDDLNAKDSKGFGSLAVHSRLLLAQLDECLGLKPDLLSQSAFVGEYLARLAPGADADFERDSEVREAYLERLGTFVSRLSPAFNSLKAHVFYHRLKHDMARGAFDPERFLAYVRLPRNAPYWNPERLKRESTRGAVADLSAAYRGASLFPPVGDDEPVVRAGLERIFLEGKNVLAFAPYFEDRYFKRVQAETGILYGVGSQEAWQAQLTAGEAQALRDRVDIDFAPTNREHYGPEEPVVLDVFLKNTRGLLVKVFEINTASYYRERGREVDGTLDLDGLVAGEERVVQQNEPPLRRVARRIELGGLTKRGTYVVELIGNGKASRSVIRKGHLSFTERQSVAGQVLVVLDERGRKVPGARIWMGAREYAAESDGSITLPYSQKPGREKIVLLWGDFATLASFEHRSESYKLEAGIYVERESLVAGRKARAVIRPAFSVNGTPATLSVLEEPVLVVTSTDRDGISSSQELKPFELHEDRESTHELFVPPRLAKLELELKARVESLSQGKKVDLSARTVIPVNGVDATDKLEQVHLLELEGESVLELLGRTGEARRGRVVNVELKHRDFREPVKAVLATDERGRVALGKLSGIAWVAGTGPEGPRRVWALPGDEADVPAVLHGKAGEDVELVYPKASAPARSEVSLLELVGSKNLRDRFDALSYEEGLLRLKGLGAGDYRLRLKESERSILVKVAAGDESERGVLSGTRRLELLARRPLSIASVGVEGDALKVRLGGPLELARVHVAALRYVPDEQAYDSLAVDVVPRLGEKPVDVLPSMYVTGRDIGEEHRYVLERKQAKKLPGNMLERPGLLLQPWAVAATETATREAAPGAPPTGAVSDSKKRGGAQAQEGRPGEAPGVERGFANLDFLGEPAALHLNLKPDKDGVVSVPRSELGGHSLVQVVAVSPIDTVSRVVSLPEAPATFRDLRLFTALDPSRHYQERREVSFLQNGEELVFQDAAQAQLEAYDTLGKVLRLFITISGDPALVEFGFVGDWAKLKREEKLAKYSKYACHELNFFLFKKDPELFKEVVRPYLENKLERTFLDDWLLGRDMRPYLDAWAFERLNAVERILLAQRVEGEGPRIDRHLRDLLELVPEDVERRDRLFDAALRGRALETTGALGEAKGEEERIVGQEEFRAPKLALDEVRKAGALPAPAAAAPLALGKTLERKVDQQRALRNRAATVAELKDAEEAGTASDHDGAEADQDKSRTYFFDDDAARRGLVRQLYRAVERTQEHAETHYYHVPLVKQDASLITPSAFWADYARHDGRKPFFSPRLAEATRSFAEMMLALAVLDLPFERAEHEMKADGRKLAIHSRGPLLIYHKQTRALDDAGERSGILVTENFFRRDDRHQLIDGEQVDKLVTGEFISHVVYGCQVVATNPTSTPQRLSVLLQIPQGSVPVLGTAATRSVTIVLGAFSVWTQEYHFYFPAPGEYAHYPVHAWKGERLVGFAEPRALKVVASPSELDVASWGHVSQEGTEEQVLEYLRARNLGLVDLSQIAWRLKEKAFFERVIKVLEERHVYHPVLWSYALLHDVLRPAREFLRGQDAFVSQCGAVLDSELLRIDPFERRAYEHLEYFPLINARAHRLGKDRAILNDKLREQYGKLLGALSYRKDLASDDVLEAAYYLLLQDRNEEAMAMFDRLGPDAPAGLQRDYLTAYVGFFRGSLDASRRAAEKHAKHPVERWRKLFAEVLAQLREIEGKPGEGQDTERPAQTQLASTEPVLELEIDRESAVVKYANVTECRLSYYLMDVELLFSRSPFLGEPSGQLTYVKPNHVETVKLDPAKGLQSVAIPERFLAQNVLVEVSAAGQRKARTRFAGALDVQVLEGFAQAKVSASGTGKAAPGVYVKVYAKRGDGGVRFYKDGYTDLRGRFDYGSLSTSDLDDVERFAILFLSDDRGAVVREAAPPKR